jgi:hypothetical protein
MTGLRIREAKADDATVCGRIMFDAFESLAARHAFPIEPGTPEFTDFQITAMLGTEGVFAFADERGTIVGVGYLFHAVAKSDDDVIALLGAAETIAGLGVLVPSRNTSLMAWCFGARLRLEQQSTLMTTGLYNQPRGSWLPSIGY